MHPEPYGEVLGEEPVEPLTDRAWNRLRAHPVVLAAVVVLLLAGAGALAVAATRPPEPAALALTYPLDANLADERASLSGYQVEEAPSGRPAGPPVFSAGVVVYQVKPRQGNDEPAVETRVTGMSGPGITRTLSPPVLVPANGGTAEVPLEAVLDCRQVPDRAGPGAYALRTSARVPGSRHRTGSGVMPVGRLSDVWAEAIRIRCSAWTARQDLTVTGFTARVDPHRSRFTATLTVRNAGSRPAALTAATGDPLTVTGDLPTAVPAGGTTSAELAVDLQRCDAVGAVSDPVRDGPGFAQRPLSTRINLVARSGSEVARRTAGPGELDPAATGVLLASRAQRALTAALAEACGGLNPILPIIQPGTVHLDAKRREITVPVQIYLRPGSVRTVRLRPEEPGTLAEWLLGGRAGSVEFFRSRWAATGNLRPDRTGLIEVTLRYGGPVGDICPTRGGRLPAFLADLVVPGPAGDRRVTYSATPDLAQDRTIEAALCALS